VASTHLEMRLEKLDQPGIQPGNAPTVHGSAQANASSPDQRRLISRALLVGSVLSLRSEVALIDRGCADLFVSSRDFGGRDGVRQSVFVGTAREASRLDVWIVSTSVVRVVGCS
jgi:hypothetical protein